MLLVLLACAPAAPTLDAAPFAGVVAALDDDHDGVLSVTEYPSDAPGALPADQVDRDGDGRVSLVEVRDAVYAVDPAAFDPLAQPVHGAGDMGRTAPGPLEEALRFLAAVQAERAPEHPAPTAEERRAAALAGMDSAAGAAVLARFAAAGVHVPDAIVHAPADPPPGAKRTGPRVAKASGVGARLVSHGPGGAAAVRIGAADGPGPLPHPAGPPRRGPPGGGPGRGPHGPPPNDGSGR